RPARASRRLTGQIPYRSGEIFGAQGRRTGTEAPRRSCLDLVSSGRDGRPRPFRDAPIQTFKAGLILPVVNSAASSRLGYIDWLRGLACVLMFQTHCYDAWLGGAARNSKLLMWSQLG